MKTFKFLWVILLLVLLMPVKAQDEQGTNHLWPVWSPDGTQIAFLSNRDGEWQIYVMRSDGSELHPLAPSNAYPTHSWSPDGKTLTYLGVNTDGIEDIYQVDVDGGEPVNLTNNRLYYGSPVWSPDGAWLAFSTKVGQEKSHLFLLDKESGVPQQIEAIEADEWNYGWSRDGRYLLAWGAIYGGESKMTIYLYDVLTQSVIDLLADYPVDMKGCCWIYYDWSPDGLSMLMAIPKYPNIYRFDIAQEVWSQVVETQDAIAAFDLVDQGQQIIYGTEQWIDEIQSEGTGVYRFNLADETITPLVEVPYASFKLSFDESKIALFRQGQSLETPARILIVDAESGEQMIFDRPFYKGFSYTWSPTEQWIAASICVGNDPDGETAIYVLDAATGAATNLTGDVVFSDATATSECSIFE
ncbi:MAG: hypothetical protein K8L97_09910 [Anaerolineae bacterium]|nr:hypothetical protein [Anaerolineae bacterium]